MKEFETSAVVDLTGIPLFYLNKLFERSLYGFRPFTKSRLGKGSRRKFSLEDLFGVALVWWLFEAGLRAEILNQVLREISKTKIGDARIAARQLCKSKVRFLALVCKPRRSGEVTSQYSRRMKLIMTTGPHEPRLPKPRSAEILCLVPIGILFGDLKNYLTFLEKEK